MTIIPDGEICYCGKKGCLDGYCSAKRLAEMTDGKLEEFFKELEQGNEEAAARWEGYTSYLAVAANNIHMVLDCDIILGGYVGSCMGEHIRRIQDKVSGRNTFAEDGTFVKHCRHKEGAAALGAALQVVEMFVEQV